MAQDPSIEAARLRIQKLVEEIAVLSRREMRSEEYFQEFLSRAAQATDARGGAVWLVAQRPSDGKSEFQLMAQVEIDSSLFHSDEQQHTFLLRQMVETAQGKKPTVAPPEPPGPAPGSLEAQMVQMQGSQTPAVPGNRTPYPFFHVPLMLKEQVVGILQLWLQPYVSTGNYQEFVTFLSSLTTHVEQHLHSRRLGTLVLENQRLQQVLKFAGDVVGSLDPLEVARLAANYGRDLIGCERCSILHLRGDRWRVLAISGQETVESKSSMVKAMAAFVGVHAQPSAFRRESPDPRTGAPVVRQEMLVLSKKELLARAEGSANGTAHESVTVNGANGSALAVRRTDEIDLAYFEHSHVISAVIAPMFDGEQELIGAFFGESTTEGFFDAPLAGKEPSGAQRVTEWLSTHTGKALVAAHDYRSIPFLAATSRLRNARHALTGRKRRRVWTRVGIIGALALLAACYPKRDQVDGNCLINPTQRGAVISEVPGRVEKVMVREGEHVAKGAVIAQLDTSRLELDKDAARQDQLRLTAEADRLRGMNNEGEAQVVALQATISEKREQSLEKDIAAATLRSPIDGVILTKDLELRTGEYLQPGALFAEIANLEHWELQVEVNEKAIGKVERELAKSGPLPVNFILYSQSAEKLQSTLSSRQQISAMAYPREKENVFVITLPGLQAPPDLARDLRPGLTGRAKVALGREPLAFWAGRAAVDWLRVKLLH